MAKPKGKPPMTAPEGMMMPKSAPKSGKKPFPPAAKGKAKGKGC